MKEAKSGHGVDRHLLGLKFIAKELPTQLTKEESELLQSVYSDAGWTKSSHWRLSTSNCGSNQLKLFGFGPVVNDGFGLGYMIHDQDITVNVTAKRNCKETSADLLASSIKHSLLELFALAQGAQSKL